MFGKGLSRRAKAASYQAAVMQWRRHELLHKLINQRPLEIVVVVPEVAQSLRRDGYLTEGSCPGDWRLTPQGIAAHARWGQNGPGRFPSGGRR